MKPRLMTEQEKKEVVAWCTAKWPGDSRPTIPVWVDQAEHAVWDDEADVDYYRPKTVILWWHRGDSPLVLAWELVGPDEYRLQEVEQ